MALTKVQADGVNLGDNFAFTGTVTGAGEWTALTPVTTNGAASYTITGIPSGVQEVMVIGAGVHRNAGSNKAVFQLGDTNGLTTSGYKLSVFYNQSSNFYINTNASLNGVPIAFYNAEYNFRADCFKIASNEWSIDVKSFSEDGSTSSFLQTISRISLSAALDRIAIVDSGGTNFDGGTLNVLYR
jgi:hypothetical protein